MQKPSIAFYFAIYHEWDIGARLIRQIRFFYPTAPIIVIADGTFNSEFASLAKNYNVFFILGDRLKPLKNGGKWWERACNAFLELTKADILIKVDPDTCLWRKFKFFPNSDWFGTIQQNSTYPFPRGGCKGIQREAINRIVKSGFLKNSQFTNKIYSYDRFGKHKYIYENIPQELLINEDLILADVAYKLKFSLANWSEVNIEWRRPPFVSGFAATHPHPTLL